MPPVVSPGRAYPSLPECAEGLLDPQGRATTIPAVGIELAPTRGNDRNPSSVRAGKQPSGFSQVVHDRMPISAGDENLAEERHNTRNPSMMWGGLYASP
jgi:hypothetical protein